VLATYGETDRALHRRRRQRSAKPGSDFFPLTVNYQEKTFAAGKIPGGYLQARRPSDREGDPGLAPDRPSDPPAVRRRASATKTQVVATVLSHDLENDPDIVAMVGASAALTLSGIPFMGPIGAARVGYHRRRIRAEPDPRPDEADSQLDLVVAGTAGRRADGRVRKPRS
jgi:polyribonucleotide nucleotidyltransferase